LNLTFPRVFRHGGREGGAESGADVAFAVC